MRTLYEIREYQGVGYSRRLGRKLRTLKSTQKIVRRLAQAGREVFLVPYRIKNR